MMKVKVLIASVVIVAAVVSYWQTSTEPPSIETPVAAQQVNESEIPKTISQETVSKPAKSQSNAIAVPEGAQASTLPTEEQAFYQDKLKSLQQELSALGNNDQSKKLIEKGDALLAKLERLQGPVGGSDVVEKPAQQDIQNKIQKLEQRINQLN